MLFAGTWLRTPFDPWPILGGTIRSRRPPFCMPSIPSSHPCEKEQCNNSWQNQHFLLYSLIIILKHCCVQELLTLWALPAPSFTRCSFSLPKLESNTWKNRQRLLTYTFIDLQLQTCQTDSFKLPVNWLVQWVHDLYWAATNQQECAQCAAMCYMCLTTI